MPVWHLHLLKRLPKVGGWHAAGASILLVACGVLIQILLDPLGDAPPPVFIIFGPVIAFASLLGGITIGLCTVLGCAIAGVVFWTAPFGSWQIAGDQDISAATSFLMTGSVLALLAGSTRLLLDEVRASAIERDRAARESVHRIKNLIAVTLALLRHSASGASSAAELEQRLKGRLLALSLGQEMLIDHDLRSAHLIDVVERALGPFEEVDGLKIVVGPDVEVAGAHVSGLSLALYELATNSLKYGALAEGGGYVELGWHTNDGRIYMEWRETLPPGQAIKELGAGFGMTLIRAAFGADASTRVQCDVKREGIVCIFEWPLPKV